MSITNCSRKTLCIQRIALRFGARIAIIAVPPRAIPIDDQTSTRAAITARSRIVGRRRTLQDAVDARAARMPQSLCARDLGPLRAIGHHRCLGRGRLCRERRGRRRYGDAARARVSAEAAHLTSAARAGGSAHRRRGDSRPSECGCRGGSARLRAAQSPRSRTAAGQRR